MNGLMEDCVGGWRAGCEDGEGLQQFRSSEGLLRKLFDVNSR